MMAEIVAHKSFINNIRHIDLTRMCVGGPHASTINGTHRPANYVGERSSQVINRYLFTKLPKMAYHDGEQRLTIIENNKLTQK